MSNKPELPTPIEPLESNSESQGDNPRKAFVEPELSSPISVLEATTFQPPVASGGPII